ncbi:MAG: S1 RNA-binding domain-containing protein [Chloroflexi bacterium]|nr:S1 RNA-binding domain-containing protein [Chloroflexota bacterium]
MSAEELGKDDEVVESESSAELSQIDAVAAEKADALTEDAGVKGENVATQARSGINNNPDELESPDTEPNSAVQADASAEASETDSVPSNDGTVVTSDPVAEGSESETVAAPAESEAREPATESSAQTKKEPGPKDDDPPKYRRGQICGGVITKTSPTAVFVDLGDGDEGLVPGRELELMTRKMLESLIVGAEVDVYVVNPRNHRGETVLSINHALEELDWRKAEEFAKSKNVYEASIGGYNKGGLIVRFGRLRGFVPQSQLAEERARGMSGETPEERYSPMVNQPIGVKVMEVDRKRNRLILSERAATREVRQRRKRELIEELALGEIRKGTVVSLETFGAFVDIGGAEGLVHLTELAWGHITHPRQVVSVGDEVEVEVISINSDARRIGLSRRRIMSDPWDEVAGSLRRGQLVRGRVTKLTKFGAFARLIDNDAVEGLIHISELSGERVSHPRDVVKRGDELVLRIVKIDIKERRLGLSLKSVNSTEYLDLDWEMAIQESASMPMEAPAADPPAEPEAQTED